AFRQKHNQCKIDRAPFAFDHALHGSPDLTHDLDNVAERVRRFGTPPDFGRLLVAQGHEQTLRGLNVSPQLCPFGGSPLVPPAPLADGPLAIAHQHAETQSTSEYDVRCGGKWFI